MSQALDMEKVREWVRRAAGNVGAAVQMAIEDPGSVPVEILNTLRRTIDRITTRKMAYVAVFDPESPTAQEVLKDLARFCRASRSTFHADPRVHAVAEGRREVWLRIQENLHLTEQQLLALYGDQ